MPRGRKSYFEIKKVVAMAKQYGVENNALFLQSLKNYDTIQKTIEGMEKVLSDYDTLVTKEYVKGRENVYLNPVIRELPKQIDAANKTIATMITIIKEFGVVKDSDEFLDFINS